MPANVISVDPKNERTVAVTLEGPDRASVNDTAARTLALQAAAQAGLPRAAVRRMNGARPYHPDGTPHEGNGALPEGSVWRQTFDLESVL